MISWNFVKKSYFYLVALSYLLYFITLFGVMKVNPAYLLEMNTFLKYYVCTLLIVRFNPLQVGVTFDRSDQLLVFSSAIFLLSTTGLNTYMHSILSKTKSKSDSEPESIEKNTF